MENLLTLLVLLLLARAFGEAAERLGHVASVGELLAGVLLAVIILRPEVDLLFLEQAISSDMAREVVTLAIFFLALMVGIDMEPREIAESSTGGLFVALGGVALPLAVGIGIGWLVLPASDAKLAQAFLIGIIISITSIPAALKILEELQILHSPAGKLVVSAALFDDVIAFFLLAVLMQLLDHGGRFIPADFALLLAKIGIFIGLTWGLGTHVYPRVHRRASALRAVALEFTILMIVAMAYAVLAQALGLHWIIGAFLAGLFFVPGRVGSRSYHEMRVTLAAITSGFLAPIFFVYIGLSVDLKAFVMAPVLVFALLAAAIIGKMFGAGVPALILGMTKREAATVGAGMCGRGAVDLVILAIAIDRYVIDPTATPDPVLSNLFSGLVIMVVGSTLFGSVLLRLLVRPTRQAPNTEPD